MIITRQSIAQYKRHTKILTWHFGVDDILSIRFLMSYASIFIGIRSHPDQIFPCPSS